MGGVQGRPIWVHFTPYFSVRFRPKYYAVKCTQMVQIGSVKMQLFYFTNYGFIFSVPNFFKNFQKGTEIPKMSKMKNLIFGRENSDI